MRKHIDYRIGAVAALLLLCGSGAVQAARVVPSDYRLPAALDRDVTARVSTEIWATVWRPEVLSDPTYPLILFLHGNHSTCGRVDPALGIRVDDRSDYTATGRCPRGYVVAPSHRGYGYLADELAAAGYIVVSINANRGINAADGEAGDDGLNLRRGRLVLKHLALLSRWNRDGGAPSSLGFNPKGRLDFGQIGLMGHSRGGEGMRAALALYAESGSPWRARIGTAGFKALFEIAPVDGQTSRTLDARGVAWNVLLPYCDGDVSSLEGVWPFDRMLRATREAQLLPKSTFAVFGANYNFYNTEWQESDSPGCAGLNNKALFPRTKGSASQRQTASASLVPFMRAHVGKAAQPARANLLNPDTPVPAALTRITAVDRGYTDTPDRSIVARIEDFDRSTGTSGSGQPALVQGISLEHVQPPDHAFAQRAAAISWSGTGRRLYQTNWTAAGTGRSLSGYKVLEFRVSQQCGDACWTFDQPRSVAGTDFSVQLVRPDGSVSRAVALASYVSLRGPVGLRYDDGLSALHPILMTARIPLCDFGLAADDRIRGVRFTFDRTREGAIHLANIRLSKRTARVAEAMALATADSPVATAARTSPAASTSAAAPVVAFDVGGARVTGIRPASAARSAGAVEIEITADRPLPTTDALPILTIGRHLVRQSRLAEIAQSDRIIFTLTAEQFAQLADGAGMELRVGAARRMALGKLNKAMLR